MGAGRSGGALRIASIARRLCSAEPRSVRYFFDLLSSDTLATVFDRLLENLSRDNACPAAADSPPPNRAPAQ
jgi:hypothetical protein